MQHAARRDHASSTLPKYLRLPATGSGAPFSLDRARSAPANLNSHRPAAGDYAAPTSTAAPTPTATPEPTNFAITVRPSAAVLEEGGEVALDVFLNAALSREITVNLQFSVFQPGTSVSLGSGSGPIFRASASRLVFRAGQTRGRVVLRAPDDSTRFAFDRIECGAFVTTPEFSGFGVARISFRDNDAGRLFLRANGTVWREGDSRAQRLLEVSSNLRGLRSAGFLLFEGALITLRSSRPDVVQVPAAPFREDSQGLGFRAVQVLERAGISAPTRVRITASAPGLPTVAIDVIVVDRDAPRLALRLFPDVLDEDSLQPASGVVFRAGDLSQPLQVLLSLSNPGLARLPRSVTIRPAPTESRS
jgi:hypothetical protein